MRVLNIKPRFYLVSVLAFKIPLLTVINLHRLIGKPKLMAAISDSKGLKKFPDCPRQYRVPYWPICCKPHGQNYNRVLLFHLVGLLYDHVYKSFCK